MTHFGHCLKRLTNTTLDITDSIFDETGERELMRQIAKYVMLVSFVAGIQSTSALTFKSDGSVV